MSYKVQVSGIIHSVDPVFSPLAYGRATLACHSQVDYDLVAPKQLKFTLKSLVIVNDLTELQRELDEMVIGDHRNIEWTLKLGSFSEVIDYEPVAV